METQSPTPFKALRKPAVLDVCGFSNTQLYKLVKAGKFPAPFNISDRLVAWPSDKVEAWLRDRASSRAGVL